MATVSLNVMQFNIEYGGTGVAFDSVGHAIRACGADVVAIQEGCGNMAKIAADLHWGHYDVRTQVVSKFPLLHPPEPIAGVIFVEVAPAQIMALINVHPASRRYGPTKLAKGASVKQTLTNERKVRVADLEPSLHAAKALISQGIPVVLLGDFNAPSHRDWTEKTVGLRPHMVAAIEWPTSIATEAVGLTDVYRALYPDPVTHPGLTWPAHRAFVKGFNPAAKGRAADRIDLMFASARVRAESIHLIGEAESQFTDIVVDPWPTDHRAIVARLEVAAAAMPTLVSTEHRVVDAGQPLTVRYYAAEGDAGRVVLVPQEGSVTDVVVGADATSSRGSELSIGTQHVSPGAYDVLLVAAAGHELARTRVWFKALGSTPTIATVRPTYAEGEEIVMCWNWAPGNRHDWIGVYAKGADPASDQRILSTYTDATVAGSVSLSNAVPPRRWPLPAGEYTAHLLLDDLTQSLAHVDFTILPAESTPH